MGNSVGWRFGVLLRARGGTAATAIALCNGEEVQALRAEHVRAAGLLQEALALDQAIGDRRCRAPALENLGAVAQMQAGPVRARAGGEQSVALARETGDRY